MICTVCVEIIYIDHDTACVEIIYIDHDTACVEIIYINHDMYSVCRNNLYKS